MNSFEQLEVWKECRIFRIEANNIASTFPANEKYRLGDQIIRSSRSITANIAEGYGRFHYQETIQFCRQARGSLYETLKHYICAFDNGFITESILSTQRTRVEKCLKLLNGYILYLKAKGQYLIHLTYSTYLTYLTHLTHLTHSTTTPASNFPCTFFVQTGWQVQNW